MTLLASAFDLADPAGRYRAVAAVVLAGVGAAAFVRGRVATCAAVGLPALVAAALAIAAGRADDALSLGGLAAAPAAAARALAAVGRRLGAPALAASAVAALTLWVACGGLWWADRVATLVPPERRGPVREAVLGADPLAAAAYALGYDRLHAADVYDETTVSSTTVRAPDPSTPSLAWGLVALAGGVGAGLASRRGRVAAGAA